MILKKKIPKEFYKLFRTKNRDAYMQFLVAIYEENNEVYTALGLTIEECRVIIADTIAKARIIWEDEEIEEEDEPDTLFPEDSPSFFMVFFNSRSLLLYSASTISSSY